MYILLLFILPILSLPFEPCTKTDSSKYLRLQVPKYNIGINCKTIFKCPRMLHFENCNLINYDNNFVFGPIIVRSFNKKDGTVQFKYENNIYEVPVNI
jgi:hypothetical protein